MNEQKGDSNADPDEELPRISTGSRGLDDILGGGFDPERMTRRAAIRRSSAMGI